LKATGGRKLGNKDADQKRTKTKKAKKKKISFSRVLLLVLFLLVISLVGVGCGYFVGVVSDLPSWDPSQLEGSETTVIYDKYGHPAAKVFAEENRSPVSLRELPPYLPDAFIAVEDERFYEHFGIDLRAIGRAAIANIKGGLGTEGGSTITQQLVKNAFLSPEKTLKRKIQEAILAIELERHYSKEEILEFYLNKIYFGHGAYGVQAAAQLYFGKDAQDLTLAESAMLAGIVRSPNNYNPLSNPELAKKRQELVLDLMAEQGKISPQEAEAAKKEDLKIQEKSSKNFYQYPYFIDYVISETEKILQQQGLSRETAQNMIYRGGLKIHTSLNPRIQKKMEEVFADDSYFPPDQQGKKVQAAMVLIDHHTGEIQALVGGRDYSQLRAFNRATQAKRQPGSAIKPIVVYAPALEKGYTTALVLDDVPVTFGKKTFENYDHRYRGLIPMRVAVQWSINTYAVKLLHLIGVEYAFNFAKKLGITSLDPVRDKNLSLALGGITYGVSPLEMAGAYSAFANKGVYIAPHTVRKIVDRDGITIYEAHPQRRVVMSEQTAYIMTDLLRTVVSKGTGWRAQLNRPVAGKTGTTSEDVDAWFVGYTPEFTAAVWMGFDKEARMYNVYGGTYPAKIWKAVMQEATAGLPVRDFPQPPGIVRATICSKSGLLPNAFCPKKDLITEIFVKGTVPTQTCDAHVEAEICAESGKLANPYCPNKIRAVFLKRPEVSGKVKPEDASEALPTEVCSIHGPETAGEEKVTVRICTDPRHNGVPYLANTPGLLETGGCPPEFVEEREFPASEVPKLHCPLPDHQVKKKVIFSLPETGEEKDQKKEETSETD